MSADADDAPTNWEEEATSTKDNSPTRLQRLLCCCKSTCLICGLSFVFLCLFLYSTIVQHNDSDAIQWYIFYAIQAAIPLLFIIYYFTTRCSMKQLYYAPHILYMLSGAMFIWSIVNIIVISVKLGEGDPDEELTWELGGVCLGAVSDIYHIILMACFCRGKRSEQDIVTTDGEEN